MYHLLIWDKHVYICSTLITVTKKVLLKLWRNLGEERAFVAQYNFLQAWWIPIQRKNLWTTSILEAGILGERQELWVLSRCYLLLDCLWMCKASLSLRTWWLIVCIMCLLYRLGIFLSFTVYLLITFTWISNFSM